MNLVSEPAGPVEVRFTPEFKRNLRALSKKYRHIRSEVGFGVSGVVACQDRNQSLISNRRWDIGQSPETYA